MFINNSMLKTRAVMGKRILMILVCLFLLPSFLFARGSKIGTTAAPFLTIGVGSRPQAMGGAFVAMADDAHSLFWNPAGLARMQQSEVILVHSTWLADMSFDYVGTAFVMGEAGTVGISATLLSVGEMEVTTERYQEGTGLMFNSYDLAAGVSYGYQFYDRFSIGASLKYIHQAIWNEAADGFAFDIGTLLITPLKDIRLGMSIANFGTKMSMSGRDLVNFYDPDPNKEGNNELVPSEIQTNSWKLPLTMRLGIAGEPYEDGINRLTLAMDWVVPNDNTEFLNVGMEYGYREYAMLRGGYRALRPDLRGSKLVMAEDDNGAGWTFGGGVKLGIAGGVNITIDYAFESFFRLGNVHKYSMGLRF